MILLNHWEKLPRPLKISPSKCHLLISRNENVTVYFGENEIEIINCEKLYGTRLELDGKLNFNDHYFDVYKKTSRKLNAELHHS